MHTRLSAADQAECKRQVDAATTETQRFEVRRTFEAKAGLRAGSAATSGNTSGSGATSGTTPRTNPDLGNAPSATPDTGRAGKPPGSSVGDPIGADAARDAGTSGTTSKPLGPK
jgi:hypothetical protein